MSLTIMLVIARYPVLATLLEPQYLVGPSAALVVTMLALWAATWEDPAWYPKAAVKRIVTFYEKQLVDCQADAARQIAEIRQEAAERIASIERQANESVGLWRAQMERWQEAALAQPQVIKPILDAVDTATDSRRRPKG